MTLPAAFDADPVPDGPADPAPIPQSVGLARSDPQFVEWLRTVAPYSHAFRGKTFVIGVAGELIAQGQINHLVQDLSLLSAMGMRLVIVYGSRPQVIEQLRLRRLEDAYVNDMRITDSAVLECVKEAAGEIRLDLEAAFSQGLPNTPMQNSTVRAVSGNFVTARPVGIINGIDLQYTGQVRKIDTQTIRFALDSGAIVIMSPLGFSPTGDAFNLTMEDVASSTAIALDADKLLFLAETDGILDQNGELMGEISEAEAQVMLDAGALEAGAAYYLRHALRACKQGVARAHIVPFRVDGSLLLELFRHDGVGTMLVEETLEALREARLDDVGGILAIIRPMEDEGILVKRDHSLIERDIEKFSVIEHDGVIFGCAALFHDSGQSIGEMACLAVNPHVQSQGDGERLLRHIEHRARRAGLKQLYVLTTRTMHWFVKRGFKPSSPDDLPAHKRDMYNWNRRSQVLIKTL
ncbi:MAG: amino-acid N-acetyltransferase [Burkholderiaceae bacterium]